MKVDTIEMNGVAIATQLIKSGLKKQKMLFHTVKIMVLFVADVMWR